MVDASLEYIVEVITERLHNNKKICMGYQE